jgi:hypothetical protein
MQQIVSRAKSLVRLPTLPYAAYKPNTSGRNPWTKGTDIDGQTWFRTQVQELWVYSHQIDRYGTMEFRVYNPQTQMWAAFIPAGYISGKNEFNAIASATGEFGRVYGNTLAATAVTLGTFGVAAERIRDWYSSTCQHSWCTYPFRFVCWKTSYPIWNQNIGGIYP